MIVQHSRMFPLKNVLTILDLEKVQSLEPKVHFSVTVLRIFGKQKSQNNFWLSTWARKMCVFFTLIPKIVQPISLDSNLSLIASISQVLVMCSVSFHYLSFSILT